MRTEEIVYNLKFKSKRSILFMTIVYILYEMGYRIEHISKALGIGKSRANYNRRVVADYLSVNDKKACEMYELLKQHEYELSPIFEKNWKGVYSVGAHIIVDNIKI